MIDLDLSHLLGLSPQFIPVFVIFGDKTIIQTACQEWLSASECFHARLDGSTFWRSVETSMEKAATCQDWKHLYPFPAHHDLDRRLVVTRMNPRDCQSSVLIVWIHLCDNVVTEMWLIFLSSLGAWWTWMLLTMSASRSGVALQGTWC